MSKEEQEKREVLALISWLQTFDQFPFSVVDGVDGDNVKERFSIALESLENAKISCAVVHVAEEVCNIRNIDVGSNPTADEIWRTLLHIATTKSRFEIYTTPHNVSSSAEIPHVVLSNLLDFAVTSPDLDERRKYIQRIMSLSKSVQKILMNLIERMKKTLPRKPKTPSRHLSSGRKNQAEGPDAPIQSSKGKDSFPHDDCENASDATPPPETSQRLRSYGTPKRERNVHGIPQSEPRAISTGRASMRGTQSDQKPLRSSSRMRHHDSDDADMKARQPEGRQPEGHYLTEKRKCHKGMISPSKDRQQGRRPKGFVSPSKQRYSTGSVEVPAPFRERQVQVQRAAFVSIDNQNARYACGATNKKGIAPPPPPPPHPTAPEQKMPASSTPSDEFEIDNHLSIPLTNTTTSTSTGSSQGTSTDLAVLRLDSSAEIPKAINNKADKKRQGDAFSTPSRRKSLLDSPARNQTPEVSLAQYERDVDARMMLSPDDSMLQSPMGVDDFVKDLRAKNKSLESILQSYQKRERELSQKMESTESKLRKEMMKLESRALGREDELRRNYENEVAKLKKELRAEKEKNKESKRAKEELANATDELDLMQHTHEKLLEATEKIRKYKERLDSMSDYKEALQREQEAHNKSVDECVRLQNELNSLQPLKRQLEDYKTKALETEVKLAECTDALRRLERERDELDGARNDVMREAMAQKAQAEELRNFIRVEEKVGGPGIGEGISELNPELHEELIKLRNENEKLKAFAAERTDDSVQRLQEDLEDSTMRQERFKEEYLKSKNKLEDTESLLAEAKQKLAELEEDIEKKDMKAQEYENKLQRLEDTYAASLETLEGLQEHIEEIEADKANLEVDLAEWKEMSDKLEAELQKRSSDLEATKTSLQETEKVKQQLEASMAEETLLTQKLEADLQKRKAELESTLESLATVESEKCRAEGDIEEWKQTSQNFEAQLLKKNEELEATLKSVESLEEEKAILLSDLSEWKDMAQKLEQDLKDQSTEMEEKTKQLQETEEALSDAAHRHEELMNRMDGYEQELQEKDKEIEKVTKTLRETSRALKAAENAMEEASRREANLNEECHELKEVSEKLVNQLKEEKRARKEMIEEHHKTLEATREVLNSKAKKDMEELQENMNKLLNDERKAYRVKNEKAQHDYKKLEEKYSRRLLETRAEADASVKSCKEESLRQLKEQEEKFREEIANVKKQEDLKRDNLIEKGQAMIEEAKEGAARALQKLADEKSELNKELEQERAFNQQMSNKNSSLKKKLEYATHQIHDLEQEQDDKQERIKKLEREQAKLEEENERYRRQLGGRYGADGQMQSQLDKLNKELMEAHNENRDLKRKLAAKSSVEDMSTSFDGDNAHTGYSRGGVNTHAIAQIRSGYEEQIANLNDEKRELVMKNSAAITDVQKAEQLAWEREQEILRLKEEKLSLQLQLQRSRTASVLPDEDVDTSIYSQAVDVSFSNPAPHGTHDDHEQGHLNHSRNDDSPPGLELNNPVLTPIKKNENTFSEAGGSSNKRSPVADAATAYERHLRDLRRSPKRAVADKSNSSFELRPRNANKPAPPESRDDGEEMENSLMKFTALGVADEETSPECNQQ